MSLDRARALVRDATKVVFLTGAGVSTESGIPDFRSPGGLYSGVKAAEILSLSFFYRHPAEYYAFFRQRIAAWSGALPNSAHRAIADLELEGRVLSVVTQNIDGLHRKAGSRSVIELHGNISSCRCVGCGAETATEALLAQLGPGAVPRCEGCGNLYKPTVVLFEEAMPEDAVMSALDAAQTCDLFVVAGTSLSVMPAAALPEVAHGKGVPVIIVNKEPTRLDYLASAVIHGSTGETLSQLAQEVVGLRNANRVKNPED